MKTGYKSESVIRFVIRKVENRLSILKNTAYDLEKLARNDKKSFALRTLAYLDNQRALDVCVYEFYLANLKEELEEVKKRNDENNK